MVNKNFKMKFLKNNGQKGVIVIQHKIFGEQKYEVDKLNIFHDGNRVGVRIKGQELYIQLNDIEGYFEDEGMVEIESKMKKIQIFHKGVKNT